MKTHPLEVGYLVIGLVYLGIAGSWALHRAGLVDAASMDWLLPATLVVAGGVGLLSYALRAVRRTRSTPPEDDR